jgi:cobalt/nickel transport system permease protein
MKNIDVALYNIKRMDEISEQASFIHSINSIAKIIVTIAFIIKVLSLKSFILGDIAICIAYPLLIFILGGVPILFILKKTNIAVLLSLGIVLGNLFVDLSINQLLFSLLFIFKCFLSVVGTLLLIATTGINEIAFGLKRMRVPNLFVIQIMLLYRYIALMLEEGYKIVSAYKLRSGDDRGIRMKDFQGILGAMLLRSIDRGENVYQAMKLRGFDGECYSKNKQSFNFIDLMYIVIALNLFIFV